jgi:hypothetical protein
MPQNVKVRRFLAAQFLENGASNFPPGKTIPAEEA